MAFTMRLVAAAIAVMMTSTAWAQESQTIRESLDRAASQPLVAAVAAHGAPAARPDRGVPSWVGWTVTTVGIVGLIAVEQRCDGLRVGDRCVGETAWPAGQMIGWSAVAAGGVALLAW